MSAFASFFILSFTLCGIPNAQQRTDCPRNDSLVTYQWIGSRAEGAVADGPFIGMARFEIDVPKGFEVRNSWYGEGLLSTLNYEDGSIITLHVGFLMQFPPDEDDAREYASPTGEGRVQLGNENELHWGAFLEVYGRHINVLFHKVPSYRQNLFLRALHSVRIDKDAG